MEACTLSEPHASLCLYNTLSKQKEPFRTVQPGKVGIYLCGPTVYDKAHIGHMVGPVLFDCIKRYLCYCGYEVNWIVNLTDVDDKLIQKATERGISMSEVAEENIVDYHKNLSALGVDQIDHLPRATESMEEIIQLTKSLVEQEYAYESQGDVYFDVAQDPNYGKLSNRSIDTVQGEGGSTAARKKNAADFALWKTAKPGEPAWDSPWGKGRPGWHIECSAMSRKLLGQTFDIHGGGLDLVFPHHENEIAQSECCHGQPMSTYWVHNGLLRASTGSGSGKAGGKVGGRSMRQAAPQQSEPAIGLPAPEDSSSGKMSRSKGAGGLADLIGRQGGEKIRFFLLRTHYRSTVLFNEPAIEEAGIGLDGFHRLLQRYARISGEDYHSLSAPSSREAGMHHASHTDLPENKDLVQKASACRDKFIAAMDDDFNTGGAIGELFELARLINKFCDQHDLEGQGRADTQSVKQLQWLIIIFKEFANILGLFSGTLDHPQEDKSGRLEGLIELIIELRAKARANKDFATADVIRDGVGAIGITLEDRAGGTEWSGGKGNETDGVIGLLVQLRAAAKTNKDFDTADTIRDRLDAIGIRLEDRPSGTEWS
jgi:cysteinyl-tRNA synthetase